MPRKRSANKTSNQGWPKVDRRKAGRRVEDRAREQALRETGRKLRSLLELGQLIGLDLQIDSMLLQIAQKAAEVMGADRCTLFLHDPRTDELWSTVAMGMGDRVIRIPSGAGMAGHCFKTGETVNLEDAYKDPRFNREIDAQTGYRTRSLLCMPVYKRAGEILGAIQLLNKKDGVFTREDETFLRTFATQASVFIEMAQLQKGRIEALEQSREELRRLNRAKDKALNHLSHELKTPLSVVQGTLRLLERKVQGDGSSRHLEGFFKTLEKHLNRLLDIQQETDEILRAHQEIEVGSLREDFDRLGARLKDVSAVPPYLIDQWNDLKAKMSPYISARPTFMSAVNLFHVVQATLEEAKKNARHREIHFFLEGRKDISVFTDEGILVQVVYGLLKNAIENTPDEGMIGIILEQAGQRSLVKVQDFGTGITEENQKYIFDGLFATQETELYSSKRPYDFNAGGKGLDLLRMKVYSQRFGFEIWMESRRCIYAPTDRDSCPGKISQCLHCRRIQDCLASGGSTFCVSFPTAGEIA